MTLHFTGRSDLMASWVAWMREWIKANKDGDIAGKTLAGWHCGRHAAALRDAPMDGEGP